MNELYIFVAGIVGILAGAAGVWTAIRPAMLKRQEDDARSRAIHDALLGDAEQRDLAGQLIRPGTPGLIHRVATVESDNAELKKALTRLATVVSNQEEMRGDIARLKGDRAGERLGKLEPVVAALLTASAERAATADAAAQALRLVHERDTLEGDTP